MLQRCRGGTWWNTLSSTSTNHAILKCICCIIASNTSWHPAYVSTSHMNRTQVFCINDKTYETRAIFHVIVSWPTTTVYTSIHVTSSSSSSTSSTKQCPSSSPLSSSSSSATPSSHHHYVHVEVLASNTINENESYPTGILYTDGSNQKPMAYICICMYTYIYSFDIVLVWINFNKHHSFHIHLKTSRTHLPFQQGHLGVEPFLPGNTTTTKKVRDSCVSRQGLKHGETTRCFILQSALRLVLVAW